MHTRLSKCVGDLVACAYNKCDFIGLDWSNCEFPRKKLPRIGKWVGGGEFVNTSKKGI
jgi:hypothetical protein